MPSITFRTTRVVRAALLVIVVWPVALATAVPFQHGLSGSWYQPRTQGEGIVLEVYPNAIAPGVAFLQGSWLTFYRPGVWDYDLDTGPAAQRWYTFGGAVRDTDSMATLWPR